MSSPASGPLLNMRFRIEVEGMPGTGAVEVVFPQARLSGGRKGHRTTYGTLFLRRGIGQSDEWYAWWDEARRTRTTRARNVVVTLLDESGASARRWTFPDSRPIAYSLSNLNALGHEALIETLELTVGGFEMSGSSSPVKRRRASR